MRAWGPLVLLTLAAGPAAAQGGWVLVRPPLDAAALEALGRDRAFQRLPEDAQRAAIRGRAVNHGAALDQWTGTVVYPARAACESARIDAIADVAAGVDGLRRHVPPGAEGRAAKARALTQGEVELDRTGAARCMPETSGRR